MFIRKLTQDLSQGYHMKLVLDYIYGGAMYLCGAHMQYVIQVEATGIQEV